jgi:hypothetical protein
LWWNFDGDFDRTTQRKIMGLYSESMNLNLEFMYQVTICHNSTKSTETFEVISNSISIFSAYLTENTPRLSSKCQSVNTLYNINYCGENAILFLNDKAGGTYSNRLFQIPTPPLSSKGGVGLVCDWLGDVM